MQSTRVVSLRDLARLPVKVPVSLGEIEVRGVNSTGWLRVLERFPKLQALIDKKLPDDEAKDLSIAMMPAIIVEGLRESEDPDAIELAMNLDPLDQARLFQAIMKETVGNRAPENPTGPSGKRVARRQKKVARPPRTRKTSKAPATTLPPESSNSSISG
jgi:hypothetical protein